MTQRSPTPLLDASHADSTPARCALVRARECSRSSLRVLTIHPIGKPSITDLTITAMAPAPTRGLRRTKSPRRLAETGLVQHAP